MELNEKGIITYQPYKAFKIVSVILYVISQFYFSMFVWCVITFESAPKESLTALLIMAVGYVLTLVLAIRFRNSSNIVYYFESTGIRATGARDSNYRFAQWQEFSNAYYVQGYKGDEYLLLTPTILDKKQAKKYMNKSGISGEIFIDGVWIIKIYSQEAEKVKKYIKELFPNNQHFGGAWLSYTE